MFDKNGVFTPNNWNSDEIVYLRSLLASLPDYSNFPLPYTTSNCTVSKLWRDDTNYIIVTENTVFEDFEGNTQVNIDTYIITWYKNRGSIDNFMVNGEIGTKKDYDWLIKMLFEGVKGNCES